MSENVPWSEYLQKSIHYNSINSNKEPGTYIYIYLFIC